MNAVPMSANGVPAPDPDILDMQIKLAWELYESRSIEEREMPGAREAAGGPPWIEAQLVGSLLQELDRLRAQEPKLKALAVADRQRELVLAADIVVAAVDEHKNAGERNWNALASSWERLAAAAHAYRLVRQDPDWRRKLVGAIRALLDAGTEAERAAVQQPADAVRA